MWNVLWVGLGGFVGASCRYWVGSWIQQLFNTMWLPTGTMIVNLLGCLLIGMLGRWGEAQQWLNEQMRFLLITGVLGGFTTFSSFGYETLNLLRHRQIGWALLYVGGSIVFGLLAVWFGYNLASQRV